MSNEDENDDEDEPEANETDDEEIDDFFETEMQIDWSETTRISCIDHTLVLSMKKVVQSVKTKNKYLDLIKTVKTVVKSVIYFYMIFLMLFLDSKKQSVESSFI